MSEVDLGGIGWPIPPVPERDGSSELSSDLDADRLGHVTALARRADVPPEALIAVVWRLVLDRLFSRADVPLRFACGTTWAVRLHEGTPILRLVVEAGSALAATGSERMGPIGLGRPAEDAVLTLDWNDGSVELGYARKFVPDHTAEELLACVLSLVDGLGGCDVVADARAVLSAAIATRRPPHVNGPRNTRTAAEVFAKVLKSGSDGIAVRHRGTALTYSELGERAGGVAAWLRVHGISGTDVVATVLDRSVNPVVAALGCWAAGAAYAHLDPEEPDGRIVDALSRIGARAVVCDESSAPRFSDVGLPVLQITDAGRAPYRPVRGYHTDCAYLVLTSGTTGRPKAVEVPHRALVGYVDALLERIGPALPASFGTSTTFASDLGNTSVYGALLSGGRLDVYDRDLVLDPLALRAELAEHPVDLLKCTPSHLAALTADGDTASVLPRRVLVVGGEAFPPALARRVLDAQPDLALYNHYGPTEATVGSLVHRVTSTRGPRIPIGTPLTGVVAQVVDEAGEPVVDGVPGMLLLGGRGLANGYLAAGGDTDDAFVRSADGTRWYRTGDLVARNADGDVEFLGRVDRQLKIRGHRVEPAEVEAALTALPGVADAVVTGEPTPAGQVELVAYVVSSSPVDLGALRGRLPAALVPAAVHPVTAIPLTANGKIDFAGLRGERPPDVEVGVDAPRTDTERLVASVWLTVLSKPRIGRDEKFLEVGGDSLKSLAVFGKLRRHYPALTIATLFKHPSIAELAAALDGAAAPADSRTAPAGVEL
ncbi:non-ribosomal peptide synthetase [Lentzea albida]|uniref:Amino acid adenylation domain-containing protein n=1 Tax=Lentzea albida TaxID=65499 RepID=A0A1H9C2B1_9PSEU|nr:non-ribosomal peptide synthetase [Lentzea albida]SEP95101.1 amino acid adenylation domain-containing protein [Lentzea albida]